MLVTIKTIAHIYPSLQSTAGDHQTCRTKAPPPPVPVLSCSCQHRKRESGLSQLLSSQVISEGLRAGEHTRGRGGARGYKQAVGCYLGL